MAKKTTKNDDKSKDFFDFKKEMLKISLETDVNKHKMRLIELQFIRDTEKLKHEWELERQRIKTAEIRKDREWRTNKSFGESYSKNGY
jgi:hypothetical protein